MERRLVQPVFDQIVNDHEYWLHDKEIGDRADFTGFTLRDINGSKLNLSGAIFSHTNVFGCDFNNAMLENISAVGMNSQNTDFTRASFKEAHLARTNFKSTIFSDTDLWSVAGDGVYIISLQIGGKDVCYTSDILQINCLQFDINAIWWMHDDDLSAHITTHTPEEQAEMMAWWKKWQLQIYHIVNNYPAKSINLPK